MAIMARPVAKLLTGFFVVAALLVVATLVFTLSQPPPAPPPLPKPNGYDDLVRAARMVPSNALDFRTVSAGELRAFLGTNAAALKLASTGLTRRCQVPVVFSATQEAHLANLATFKRLGLALGAQGRLAELENRPADAAESYLTEIRLGYAIS